LVVVSDTSPLRALVPILSSLYRRVLVPPAVRAELTAGGASIDPFPFEEYPFVEVRTPLHVGTFQNCDPGESEALSLALELGITDLLIDELNGRREAERLGLRPTGVLGLLVTAKRTGLIRHIAPLLDQLQARIRFRVSRAVRDKVLREAGEI
jgi:uncharacterized protein